MQRENIAVIGAGIVGGSLAAYLEKQRHHVSIYDPPKGHADADAVANAETVFVCVPTPYVAGSGFDTSFIVDAISRLTGERTVVIKSTVLPGTTDLMQERFPQHRFLFNPEFLREATAYDDFINPDRQIVGTTPAGTPHATRIMAMLPRAPYELICGAAEAEMAKYAANSFLAVKVSFANEMFDLCARLRIDYAFVRDIVAADARIGASHMDVFDAGYRGYGGKCLPKDSKSLLDLASASGVELQVLRAADRVNAALRPNEAAPRPLRAIAPEIPSSEEQAA